MGRITSPDRKTLARLSACAAFFTPLFAVAGLAGPARADLMLSDLSTVHFIQSDRVNYVEVIDALTVNGYQIVSVTDTMLNRVRIRARNVSHLREIVVSRASGQVLRDAIIETYAPIERPEVVPAVPLDRLMRNAPGGGIVVLPP